jgi:pSer/pThr/pTyr-binding forkhead associated (FHA) protein
VKLKLLCQDPLASPREIILEHFPVEMGRGLSVGVRIDDRWLSRRHCRIDQIAGALVVQDLGSRHGTFINGRSVSQCQLQAGDELCIGLTHFVADFETTTVERPVHESGQLIVA